MVKASHTLSFWWLEFGENPGFVSGIISTERLWAGFLPARTGLTSVLAKGEGENVVRLFLLICFAVVGWGCDSGDSSTGENSAESAVSAPTNSVPSTDGLEVPVMRTPLGPDAGLGTREEGECVDLDGDGYGENCEAGPDCDDRHGTANAGANEQCGDGIDNDCDGRVEENCGCQAGESLPCYPAAPETAGVGRCRMGFRACQDGAFGACENSRIPMNEICNQSDDDCDGRTDEGVGNACGGCGPLPEESCDGADNDCDGYVDEGVSNACGGCGLPPEEYCDGIDNDCDLQTDEDCRCMASLAAPCYEGPPGTRGVSHCRPGYWSCDESGASSCVGQVLPEHDELRCDGMDDDCDGSIDEGLTNRCGECGAQPLENCEGPTSNRGNGLDDDCDGFIDEGCFCTGRLQQPCYSGPPRTLGQGTCTGGTANCEESQITACVGEVLPASEVCGDGLDTDCDGRVDEGCPADACEAGEEVCDNVDNDCDGQVDELVRGPCGCLTEARAEELCGESGLAIDDDCDGRIDEVCSCKKGPPASCYLGPVETIGIGECRTGRLQCDPNSNLQQGSVSGCRGYVGPRAEICNGLDDDCDGTTDEQPADGNACGGCGSPPEETCDGEDNDCDGTTDEGVSNACGHCGPAPQEECDGLDNDCDGLVDEGVVNFCGLCGESCFELVFDERDQWELGSLINLEPAEDDPDALSLEVGTTSGEAYLWAAATNDNEVVKIDTNRCRIDDVYPTWGFYPSRTAVTTDGSVWIGNRALGNADASDYTQGNAVHLDVDGNVLCRARVTGQGSVAVRAVTIDQNGDAWVGSWDKQAMYKVSGNLVEPGGGIDNIPDCKILQEVPIGRAAYGAAVDSQGFLWVAVRNKNVLKIDTRDGSIVARVASGPVPSIRVKNGQATILSANGGNIAPYGMAIDRNDNVWYGNAFGGGGNIIRVHGTTNQMVTYPLDEPNIYCDGSRDRNACSSVLPNSFNPNRTRGIAVDLDGNIWGADDQARMLHKFAPDGEHLLTVYTNVSNAGVAVDAEGKIWAVAAGTTKRFNTEGAFECEVTGMPSLYSYSDMTGMQLLNITLRSGRWVVRLDGGNDQTRWDSIDWSGVFPSGAVADVRVRTAPTVQELPGGAWSNRSYESPFRLPDENINTGFTPRNRWLEIEVRLTRQDDGVQPRLERLRVQYQWL